MNDGSVHPSLPDIRAALARIEAGIVKTPLLRCDALDEQVGGQVFLKAECLQTTGAFKLRGALNLLGQLSAEQARRGIITYSSGNHGHAVAAAARRLGMSATVLMPADSVGTKVALTRAQGAEVIFFERGRQDALTLAGELRPSAVVVPPANHFDVISGQGTVALEILAQLQTLGEANPDMLLVPCGSGGLTAGCALVLASLAPDVQVFAVEPADFDDTTRSLAGGSRVSISPGVKTLCDALTARIPAPLTFAINLECGVRGLVVSDAEALRAMAFAFKYLKLVLEPGGAVALAAILSGKVDVRGKRIAIVCSGGNVDATLFAQAISP